MADLTRKTANLFDGTLLGGYYSDENFNLRGDEAVYKSIKVYLTAGTYTFSWGKNVSIARYIIDDEYNQGGLVDTQSYTFTSTTDGYVGVSFRDATSSSTVWDVTTPIMLNSGSIALPYEPYGWVHSLRKFESKSETIQSGDTIYADGTAISTYTIKGNTTQSGTPTPSNPVSVNGVGNKTANLFNVADLDAKDHAAINDSGVEISSDYTGYTLNYIDCKPDTDYTIYNTVIARNGGYYRLYFCDISKNFINRSASYVFTSKPLLWQLRSPANAYYFQIQYGYTSAVQSWEGLMILEGLTVPDHYIPYGFKIPISSGSTTTPIYVSQELYKLGDYSDSINSSGTATYYIVKKVLDGTETWTYVAPQSGGEYYFRTKLGNYGYVVSDLAISTHYSWTNITSSTSEMGIDSINSETANLGGIAIRDTNYANATAFAAYLAQQYENGTPVIVWYVLTTPTTESVTAPSIPTADGANTITVDTTVQPSEVSMTWTGWHDASVKEKSDNLFDDWYETGVLVDGGTVDSSSAYANYRTTDYISVDTTPYTFSLDNPFYAQSSATSSRAAFYDENKNFLSIQFYYNRPERFEQTINIPNNTKYIRLTGRITDENIMLNTGSTALPYEPYWK